VFSAEISLRVMIIFSLNAVSVIDFGYSVCLDAEWKMFL
jgi:hypothetical protein